MIGIVSARSVRVFKRRGLIELSLTGVLGIIATASFLRLITISWFQERAEPGLLGRVMSLAMFSAIALDPISFALARILVGINLTAMFVGAGALLLITATLGAERAVRCEKWTRSARVLWWRDRRTSVRWKNVRSRPATIPLVPLSSCYKIVKVVAVRMEQC